MMSNSFQNHLDRDMHSIMPRNDISHDQKFQHDIKTLQCSMEHHTPSRTPVCHVTHRGHAAACQDCGLRFTWDKSLVLHRKTLHSLSQYQCSACKRMFNRRDSFERHKRLMHKGHVKWGLAIHNDIGHCPLSGPLTGENKTVWKSHSSKKMSDFTLSMWWNTDTSNWVF